jgi:hypothetical protein
MKLNDLKIAIITFITVVTVCVSAQEKSNSKTNENSNSSTVNIDGVRDDMLAESMGVSNIVDEPSVKIYLNAETGFLSITNTTPEQYGSKKTGGGITAMGSFFLGGEYFWTNRFSSILQTTITLQMDRQNVPFRGFDIGIRKYFTGIGDTFKGKYHVLDYRLEETWKQFWEIYLGRRSYKVSAEGGGEPEDPTEGEEFFSGSFHHVLVGIGTLYQWDRVKSLSFRLILSPFSFASSGDNLTLREMGFLFGFRFSML